MRTSVTNVNNAIIGMTIEKIWKVTERGDIKDTLVTNVDIVDLQTKKN